MTIETEYIGEKARKELARENYEPQMTQVHLFAFIGPDELLNEIASQIEPIVEQHHEEIQGFEDFGLNMPVEMVKWFGQKQAFAEVTKRYAEDSDVRSGLKILNVGPGDLLKAMGLR